MDKDSLYMRNRAINIVLSKLDEVSKYDAAILDLYQNYLYFKNADNEFKIEKLKKEFCKYILDIPPEERFRKLVHCDKFIWGLRADKQKSTAILDNVIFNNEIYFIENSFLNSVIGMQLLSENEKIFQTTCGYIFDDLTLYYDATRPSRMEIILNSDFKITKKQSERARLIIDNMIKNKISKYNHQPVFEPNYGRKNVQKVLVIDQSYKDYSIIKGKADEKTFKTMLKCAIEENPDADILIKTHPDAIGEKSLKPKSYYQNVEEKNNIYHIKEAVNPISMLQYVDKIYVCSSQLGFEGLMCNKKVHTFGMPFYAGWGLTVDNQKCERRTKNRTVEEIFYIAYIYMTQYINPKTNKPCEIEEAIDYLIEYREKYFNEIKK